MHKCPTCKVPLHGYEDKCPSCGTPQVVRKSYRKDRLPEAPGINPVPFVIAVIGIGIVVLGAMNTSWIGQVMRRGPEPVDPMAGVTYVQARQIIETKITEGLTAVGAKGKFSWTQGGQPADKNSPSPLELTIDTSLSDPTQRKAIIDPIKDYMDRGKVPTLTMNDARSHATWTYSVQLSAPREDDSGQLPAQ